MSGVSPGGVAENGTRSGKRSCDLLFMGLVLSNLPSCLPSLAMGLVPTGQHYYGGSESSAHASRVCGAAEASLLISIELLSIPSLTTLLPFRSPRFDTLLFDSPCEPPHCPAVSAAARSRASSGTSVRSGVRELLGRSPTGLAKIEFTFVTDCSFAFGCSPPFLLKTQLPLATGR